MKKIFILLASLSLLAFAVSCKKDKPVETKESWRVVVESLTCDDAAIKASFEEAIAEINSYSATIDVDEAFDLVDDVAEAYDGYVNCEIILEISQDGKTWEEYDSWSLTANVEPEQPVLIWRVVVSDITYNDEEVLASFQEYISYMNDSVADYTVEEAEDEMDIIAASFDGYIGCQIVMEISEDEGTTWNDYATWTLTLVPQDTWRIVTYDLIANDEADIVSFEEEVAELNEQAGDFGVEMAEQYVDQLVVAFWGRLGGEVVLEATEDGGETWYDYYTWTMTLQEDHEYVDLGLPSGTLWATCNIGADLPQESGYYFAWGELTPKDSYSAANCDTWDVEMTDISGNPEYDAATANWGDQWCLPTKEQMEELLNECTANLIGGNGFIGYQFIGPNGNILILPLVGYCEDSSIHQVESFGYYWTSTPVDGHLNQSYIAELDQDGTNRVISDDRFYGQSIRPVRQN
ncbi:MAG: hypothetical protein J6V04_06495 [Bacteroidales bacterium]|nr:hypothetical protein [Bacteroidales bacterium]